VPTEKEDGRVSAVTAEERSRNERFPSSPEKSAPSATPSRPETESVSASDDGAEVERVFIQISNAANGLAQDSWAEFISQIRGKVLEDCIDVHMEGFSLPDAPWQNACWAFSTQRQYLSRIRENMATLAGDFGQQAVSISLMGKAEFILGQVLTKAILEQNLRMEESNWGMKAGAKNTYACGLCQGQIITVHVDHGVTPSAMSCRATPDCNGIMYSTGYRRSDQDLPPQFVWYRPEADEHGIFGDDAESNEHVRKGGLLIQSVADYVGEPEEQGKV
jgi:hypothetical protein